MQSSHALDQQNSNLAAQLYTALINSDIKTLRSLSESHWNQPVQWSTALVVRMGKDSTW